MWPNATGKWIEWHDNGIKAMEGEYLDGEEHGKWTEWYYNGELAQEW